MIMPSSKRGQIVLQLPRISCENGGAAEVTYGDAWLTGRYVSFVNTRRKPISGLRKE